MKELLVDYMKEYSDLDEGTLMDLVKDVPIKTFKKGELLIKQGEIPKECFFVLKGIARKFGIDEDGNEVTYNFSSEYDSIVIFYENDSNKLSPYSVMCVEDCVMVVGQLDVELEMYEENPELEMMTRLMIQDQLDDVQSQLAAFIRMTPEKRVQNVMDTRPELLDRVPQHQLASYLGMTPESLSRIKRRLERSHLKAVD